MLERIGEGSDGLAAVFPAMLNCMIALRALGYSKTHPVYAKAEKDFDGLVRRRSRGFSHSTVSFAGLGYGDQRSFRSAESGLSPEHPALQKAAEWLVNKEVRIRGDWAVNNPHPEASGWAFEYNNVYYPDTDDTTMVLMALRLVQPEDSQSLNELFRRALGWQLSFQCRDGGWAAFDKDVTTAVAGRHAVCRSQRDSRSHLQRPDRAHARACSATSVSIAMRQCVRDAIEYLIDTQDDDGSWYGRWGVNYIYGTWQVLRGLRAIGEDMTQDWILRGRDWLESCQNDDGGWGETCATYENPSTKGKGESTASQTAWAIMGICACGDLDRPSVQRGLRYLLRSQKPDGSWDEDANHRHRFPARLLFEVRHVSPEFPAACSRDLCELSQRTRALSELLSLRSVDGDGHATRPSCSGAKNKTCRSA